jgi:hypothetical protein
MGSTGFVRTIRFIFATLLAAGFVSPSVRAAGTPVTIVPDSPLAFAIEDQAGGDYYVSVFVYDADDNPVPFPAVVWAAPVTGPRAVLTTIEPGDEYGMSTVAIHAAGGFGTYQLSATVEGVAPVVFTITNQASPLRVVAGSHQSALINTAFAQPLVVEARAANGTPLSGVAVTFAPRSSGPSATLDATSAITDANGLATISVAANGTSGQHDVRITAPALAGADTTASFSNLLALPAIVYRQGLSSVQLRIGGRGENLAVNVYDANSRPLRNVAVQFRGPATGPSIGSAVDPFSTLPAFQIPGGGRVFTDVYGAASIQVFANDEAGSYPVEVTIDGWPTTYTFNLTNLPRTVGSIRPNGRLESDYAGSQAVIGERFGRARFLVLDSDGIPMPNVAITLTAPESGPSIALDAITIVTGTDGFAELGGTANLLPGSFYLRGDVAGFGQPAFMSMLNVPHGYSVGEPLADISVFDHAGQLQSLRAFTNNDRFLLLDVCTAWCQFCQQVQDDGQQMRAQLAAMGIPVAVVPMLVDSLTPNEPSSQADAAAWRSSYGIADPVLHASSDPSSPVVSAGQYILGADRPGYPTFLLVAPGGTIVANHRGTFLGADDMANFVLQHVASKIAIANAAVTEGGVATLTVTRSPANSGASVAYSTVAGSASGADFTARTGVVQFAPGQATATIAVATIDDVIDEPAEQFSVRLMSPVGATLTNDTALVNVADNDLPSVASIGDARFVEGTGTITKAMLPIQLDRVSAFPITVTYRLLAGSAKSTDVTLSKGEVTVAAGKSSESIPIELIADKIVETKETFTVEIVAATNATLGASLATVAIVDDDYDMLPPVIDAKSDVIVEVKMASTSQIVVDYKAPAAIDKYDGAVAVNCVAPSGSKFGYGTAKVRCAAEDKAGNLAERIFSVTVRLPAVAGAIFDPEDRATPLTEARRGEDVLVHVNAGAFTARAIVMLSFIDADGRRHDLGKSRAGLDGSLDEIVKLPHGGRIGVGQVFAHSDAPGDTEYDRGWFIDLKKKKG